VLSLDGAALSERPPITNNEHHNSRTIGEEKREQHRFSFPRACVRGITFEMHRGSHLISDNRCDIRTLQPSIDIGKERLIGTNVFQSGKG
jgi:hypothetical protein